MCAVTRAPLLPSGVCTVFEFLGVDNGAAAALRVQLKGGTVKKKKCHKESHGAAGKCASLT